MKSPIFSKYVATEHTTCIEENMFEYMCNFPTPFLIYMYKHLEELNINNI